MITVSLRPLLIALGCLAVGCSTGAPKAYEPVGVEKRTLFLPSNRHVGAPPVYARTRWVHPPEVLPNRDVRSATGGLAESAPISPVYQLTLKDVTLEEASKVLASMARYTPYVSPSLAGERFTFKSLGTIDELASYIGRTANIKVSVDHQAREVRFLVRSSLETRVFGK